MRTSLNIIRSKRVEASSHAGRRKLLVFMGTWWAAFMSVFAPNVVLGNSPTPEPIDLSSTITPEDFNTMAALDLNAREAFDQGDYAKAANLYKDYEVLVKKLNAPHLPADLLFNQALVSYKNQQVPLAFAQLKQLSLVRSDDKTTEMQQQLQRFIELKVHDSQPNTGFVRGDSNEFVFWSWSQYYAKETVRCFLFVNLVGFFACLVALLYAKKTFVRRIVILLVVYFLALSLLLMIFDFIRIQTQDLKFAILLDESAVRAIPSYDAPIATEDAFMPGLTVKVLVERENWTLIERSDKRTVWVPNEALYRLTSRSNNHD